MGAQGSRLSPSGNLPLVSLEHHYVVTDAIPELEGAERSCRSSATRTAHSTYGGGSGLWSARSSAHPAVGRRGRLPRPAPAARPRPPRTALRGHAAARMPAFGTAGSRRSYGRRYTPDGRSPDGARARPADFHVLAGFRLGIVFLRAAPGATQPSGSSTASRATTCGSRLGRFGEHARRRSSSARAPTCTTRVRESIPGGGAWTHRRPVQAGRSPRRAPRARRGDGLFRLGTPPVVLHARARATESARGTGTTQSARSAAPCAPRSACSTRTKSSPSTASAAFLDRLFARTRSTGARAGRADADVQAGRARCNFLASRVPNSTGSYLVSAAATELHDYAWLRVTLRRRWWSCATTLDATRASRLRDCPVARGKVPFLPRAAPGGVPTLTLRSICRRARVRLPIRWSNSNALRRAARGRSALGVRALDSMRLEKAYRLWGRRHVRGLDAARGRAGPVRRLRRGRPSAARAAAATRGGGRAARVPDARPDDAGNEPVRRGRHANRLTRRRRLRPRRRAELALAYLPVAHAATGTGLAVDVLGESHPAVVAPQRLRSGEPQAALVTTPSNPSAGSSCPATPRSSRSTTSAISCTRRGGTRRAESTARTCAA